MSTHSVQTFEQTKTRVLDQLDPSGEFSRKIIHSVKNNIITDVVIVGLTNSGKRTVLSQILWKRLHVGPNKRIFNEVGKVTGKPVQIEYYNESHAYNQAKSLAKSEERSFPDSPNELQYRHLRQMDEALTDLLTHSENKYTGITDPPHRLRIIELVAVGQKHFPLGWYTGRELCNRAQLNPLHNVLAIYNGDDHAVTEASLAIREEILLATTDRDARKIIKHGNMQTNRSEQGLLDLFIAHNLGGVRKNRDDSMLSANFQAWRDQAEIRATVDPDLEYFELDELQNERTRQQVQLTRGKYILTQQWGLSEDHILIGVNEKLENEEVFVNDVDLDLYTVDPYVGSPQ